MWKSILRDVSLKIESGERIALVGEAEQGNLPCSLLFRLGSRRSFRTLHWYSHYQCSTMCIWAGCINVRCGETCATCFFQQQRTSRKSGKFSPLRQEKLFSNVGQLSGGQYQRTALGRALYHPGRVIVADEPVSSVDEHQASEILSTMVRRNGPTCHA